MTPQAGLARCSKITQWTDLKLPYLIIFLFFNPASFAWVATILYVTNVLALYKMTILTKKEGKKTHNKYISSDIGYVICIFFCFFFNLRRHGAA